MPARHVAKNRRMARTRVPYPFEAVSFVTTFSRSGYADLLTEFSARGYDVVGYDTVAASEPHLVLRHDIDVSPALALPMAEVEAELGLAAHYFFLTTSEMYNSASASARQVLAALLALGHRIGLHFDTAAYPADADLDAAAAKECRALEDITGCAVTMVSFHRPAAALLNNAKDIAGRQHTYQPRYFRDIGYCSDSRGGWHNGVPLEHPAVREKRALQLLTHPVWWGGEGEAQARLDQVLVERCHALDSHLAENVTIHKPGRLADLFKGN
jgi:hypothetical protein